ncbi:AT hook motif [Candidatus Micrarchaeota archaeon RBG_16_36_9]|nr:MAG: AT hook motif [Candidatus Micrarchaeota archaeon RBG_16_36_9]
MVEKIRKRDGRVVSFEQEKITTAIFKAAQAVGGTDRELANKLSDEVVKIINERFNGKNIPTVESVQDVVEKVLVENGHYKTAKAYILYREEHKKLRDVKSLLLNVGDVIDDYISEKEWRIKENANISFSYSGLLWHGVGTIMAYYALNNIYPQQISKAHIDGDFHLHNLSMSLCGYCAGWSLRQLLMEGLNGVPGKVHSAPPKHLRSAIGQMVNFIGTLQNEWAGAQAFSSFDTYLAPYIRADKLDYKQVKQSIQEYVYGMNITSRWGGQCVSEDTEALTDKGWKKHDEINKDDKIATLNTDKDKIEFLDVKKVNIYDYDGELIRLKNRTQEQLVTPNHRVLKKKFNSNKMEFVEAEDLINFKTPVLLPITSETESEKEIIDDWVNLYAWLVSEGTFSDDRGRIAVYQSTKNKDNCENIRNCFENLDFSWHEQQRIHGFSPIPSVRFRLNQKETEIIRDKITSKIIPDVIRTLSSRQIRMFVDTYIKGDGHVEKNGRKRIYTKNEKVKDQLQELCALCGYGSTVRHDKNGIWIVNIIRRPFASITHIDKIRYKGKVWCPTTENGTFVARRNGKVFITGNSPFSNITLDWTVPEDIKNDHVVIGGKTLDNVYGDYQEEMNMVNKAFIEVMTGGDMYGRVFTWPIPTYNITKDLDWDNENLELLFNMTAKYGLPYFQNFIKSDLKPTDVRAMCCRLQLNLNELRNKTGGLFGFGESTGSIGVVTINMPRIGYQSKSEEEFFEKLDRLMYLAKNSLEIKRKLVDRMMGIGLLPFSKRYLGDFNHHFSTIGLIGMNEACQNFLGKDIADEEGRKFSVKVLEFMRDKLKEYQEETNHIYNLEATPAEGTSYRLAKVDRQSYPKIISSGKNLPFYTNSTQLPVNYTDDVFAALNHQEELQRKYTGGTVFHTFLGESPENGEAVKLLVRKIATNYALPYFTITPTFSVCPSHGYIKGEHFNCPSCNSKAEVFSRVVGYIRPVQDWNEGKQEEFKQRLEYKIPAR